MNNKNILLAIVCLTLSINVYALQPATKEQVQAYKKDGTLKQRLKSAKKLKNLTMHPELVKIAKRKIEKSFLKATGKNWKIKGDDGSIDTPDDDTSTSTPKVLDPKKSKINQESSYKLNVANADLPPNVIAKRPMPSTGTVKVPLILIDFPDYPATYTKQHHIDLAMGTNSSSAPMDSLKNFYKRASYNKLNIETHVYGWYRTPYTRASIAQNNIGREAVIMDALNHFNGQGVDFTQYDNNGDGYIDYIPVIWAGPKGEWASFWWGQSRTFTQAKYIDGKRLGQYVWQPEGSNPRVLIHETGHALGLPDLYDYDGDVGPDGGAGNFDVMDNNGGDFNPFFKWILDWTQPQVMGSGTKTFTLNPSGTNVNNNSVIMFPGANNSSYISEFFIGQNRWRVGNDDDFNHHNDGLILWHIDGTLQNNWWKYNNSYTQHKLVRLMEADSFEEIENYGNSADAGDYYVNGSCFSPYSSPNSKKYNGAHTNITIDNILKLPNNLISFEGSIVGGNCYDYPTDYVISGLSPNDRLVRTSQALSYPSITIRNNGSVTGASSFVRLHQSNDSHIGAGDFSPFGSSISGLSGLISTSIPSGTLIAPSVEGTYWYGACVDVVSGEQNTSNNCSAGAKVVVNNFAARIGEAVDNDNHIWTTGGDAQFDKQTATSYFGGDAAESGLINDDQITYFQASFSGMGKLTFYWKVSSELGYDKLKLFIDDMNTPVFDISGEKSWTEVEYEIKSTGTHTIRWAYQKDGSASNGQDKAWVDRIKFFDDTGFYVLPTPGGGAAVINL